MMERFERAENWIEVHYEEKARDRYPTSPSRFTFHVSRERQYFEEKGSLRYEMIACERITILHHAPFIHVFNHP